MASETDQGIRPKSEDELKVAIKAASDRLYKLRAELTATRTAVDVMQGEVFTLSTSLDTMTRELMVLIAPPPDRTAAVLTTGEPVPEDRSHTELKDNGQQKSYVVLSEAERANGFVRPVRDTYRHTKCGFTTTMRDHGLVETIARDPSFYTGTFCCQCRQHFTFGTPDGEFIWLNSDGTETDRVGT